MPLSEYEQRVLDQMERALTSDDPRLATTMRSSGPRSGLRWVIAGVAVVVGLLLLVVGVSSEPLIGILGFAIMFAGVLYAFTAPRKSEAGPAGVVDEDGKVASRPQTANVTTEKRSFFSRLEDRWDRRRGEGR
ncbi:DUF3040 domain-containing protein [Paraoerskovia marina]|uniref:DUF3040 domain-containing protein n=1 Tax=Paraoerskovia marina TaxID=545619 RepID=UPI000492C380|nr:DUF3040 domain-containing protein [Paraoerskovia marina]